MKKVSGKLYPRVHCKPCHNKRQNRDTPARRATQQRIAVKQTLRRDKLASEFDVKTIARRILADSRKSDRKNSREFNLTLDFIMAEITKGCSYCGAAHDEARMTLDRQNNDLGHIVPNVVPACQRCNFVRGNMPIEAWEHLKDGMRAARLAGAFADWNGPKVGAKKMVGMTGLEPMAFGPPDRRSTT